MGNIPFIRHLLSDILPDFHRVPASVSSIFVIMYYVPGIRPEFAIFSGQAACQQDTLRKHAAGSWIILR
jgi:hypothetical protein